MKQFYFLISFFVTYISFSQNFTDTKGELQISASGTATYNLPIAIPPSIKNVAPTINLTYSSGVRGGIAGQGWSINSISAISRMATRRDIDGLVDGVDFDANDKLALDGQRLLLKTGTYWATGSTYETEYKSNTKIELKIEGTTTYFIVTAPDGSRSWYGSTGSGSLQNSVSVNSWYIVRYEDVYGNFINYTYKTVTYNSTNQLYIETIVFSGNTVAGVVAQDKIVFNYEAAKRVERDYMKGTAIYASQILKSVVVYANNSTFRTYKLVHTVDDLGYERVEKLYEVNAQNEESNPVVFEYNTTPTSTTRIEKSYTNNLNFNEANLAGDFDGDGRLDFVANNQVFTNLFNGNTGNVPINLSFTKKTLFTATTLTNNKLNQFQSIVNANVINKTAIEFDVYNLVGGIIKKTYTKSIALDLTKISHPVTTNSGSTLAIQCLNALRNSDLCPEPSVSYQEGDFDGNGISEVLIFKDTNECEAAIQQFYRDPPYVFNVQDCPVVIKDIGVETYYLVDLDPNQSTALGSSGYLSVSSYDLSVNSTKYIVDFNGDGKSDILQITRDGNYKILEIVKYTNYAITNLLGSGTLDKYSYSKQMLLGDYNGDGKTDIMLPDSDGGSGQTLWHTYYSNPNPAGGSFFVKESQNIVEYWPDTGGHYDTQRHWSSYYAMDINGDGKSDLVRVWRKYYKPGFTINDHNTQWWVTAYTNNVGKAGGSGFTLTYDSDNSNITPFGPMHFNSDSPDVPIPITSNYRYQGANTDLVIVRGHYNRIEYYQFNKNVDTDNRLKSVTESSGNIKQTIDYLPMEASDYKFGLVTDFYSSSNTVTYPNIEIIRNSNSYLVSKLTATINNVSKYQDFRYRGYVSNYNFGTIGFTKTTRSSWYLSASDPKIWTTQNNDVALRGANTITWASTMGSTVFDAVPTNLLSTKTNVFATYTNPTSKVYNVLLSSQTTLDALSGIKSENIFTYDGLVNAASYYGLQIKSVAKQYSGVTLQGTTTVDTQYDSNPSGTGSTYYIGRPKQINTTATIYTGDTRTSEEVYTYTGTNLTKTEKKGHNTYAIVEDMTYDNVGNLLTKTVSAPNAPTAIAARTIKDEYDATKRFVVKKTDHQNFVTDFTYNTLGQVSTSKDYMGVVSSFTYDNWGKLVNTTVVNTSTVPISTTTVYAKLGTGGYTATTTNNLDAKTIVQYDVLGRVVVSSTKGFATNSLISKQVVYDGLGRKQKESEPYFSSPSLWTAYEYDYLMRPIKIIAPTGKIQTLSYSGLTTTSNDDGKTTTATVDAIGNKTQSTDPGGVINFTYYANGKLKESDYQGNKVQIDIDGWGNKIKMVDPSAGTYTYSYDAFGQLKTETTPNGTTAFEYDAAGKPTEKTINGTNTNSKTTYAYNAFNQITSSSFVDNLESKTTTTAFEYDSLKRVFKTTETTPYATFIKAVTFDNLGRIEKETSTATASGKTSAKTIKNTYQNGFPWQILDDTSQQVLWQTNSVNERGQLLTAALGNGIGVTNSYDVYGYTTKIKHDIIATNTNIMTLNTAFEIKRGNLNSRTNSLFSRNEIFKYDVLDRLTEYTNGLGIQETQVYDDKGRITQNNVGTYEYDTTKTYQNKAITLTSEALDYYKNRGGFTDITTPRALNVTYNTFKSPVLIDEKGVDKISFTYNDSNDRSSMFYGGLQDDKLLRTYRKHYSADGTMEIKQNIVTGAIEFITYIGGDAYSAVVIYKQNHDATTPPSGAGGLLYLHRDYQGTIVAITNQAGAVVEKRLFDAWGTIVKVQDGAGNILSGLTVLDRGYTGHEHLQSVGLVHMNGRLYDPKLHRFLQPDNYVQEPFNTQNYNKYGYCWNNPLKYTDPSGEIVFLAAVGIGAAIAALTYTVTALLADVPFSVGGLAKATFIGAASAAVTFGIGTAAGNLFTNFYSQAAFQAAAHGTFQGTMTAVSGGKFWSGFAAGALSSIASSVWSGGSSMDGYGKGAHAIADTGMKGIGAGTGNLGMIAFGTVSGGAGAALTGGNFWQGAATGLVVSGLNHFVHSMDSNENSGPGDKYKKYFSGKLKSLQNLPKSIRGYVGQKCYNGLRWGFNGLETVGGWMEIAGIAAAPFTEGASLALVTPGAWISGIGTGGNIGMDIYEENYFGASYRAFKWGVTYGMGRVIGENVSGLDATLMELHLQFYDKVVIPVIEQKMKINLPQQFKH